MTTRSPGLLLVAVLSLAGAYHVSRDAPRSASKEARQARPEPPMHAASVAASRARSYPAAANSGQTAALGDRQLPRSASTAPLPPSSAAEQTAPRRRQRFTVAGLIAKSCNVYVAVFETAAGFPQPERSTETVVVPAAGEQAPLTLDLPADRPVAIAVYQDLDGNRRLTKSPLGIPVEPYGFSNDARGTFGPPSFQQAAIVLAAGTDSSAPIPIQVR